VLNELCAVVEDIEEDEAMCTDDLDHIAATLIFGNDAYPSPLLYKDFPKSICTSVNEVAVHGIPDDRPLRLGDLVSIDVSVFLNGYHGDTCRTVVVGGEQHASPEALELIDVCRKALSAALSRVAHGALFVDIASAIEEVVDPAGMSIMQELIGHGIGRQFHQLPAIGHTTVAAMHALDQNNRIEMQTGDVFTIEPIVVAAPSYRLKTLDDNWSIVTRALSAMFEHTVRVDDDGCEVLTVAQNDPTSENQSNAAV